ncbi:hypothetical protein [Salsuginibacillus kocurii]|uniref:hypothetical protein n=1 Tax=Salsuginibacillus kocurii TaxID=427078 RepID=UPI000366E9AD|nr:hypothetical protein [Salsuginibacillus kocurii]
MPFLRFLLVVSAKTLSKIFSLATATFFGRVPSKDDSKISLTALLSVYWIFVGFAVIFPSFAEMVIPFLPDHEPLIFIIALTMFLIIPLVVGFLTTCVENQRHLSPWRHMWMGYPYAFILGVVVIFLIIIVPIIKFPQIINLRVLKHMAVMIRKGYYEEALSTVQLTLYQFGLEPEIKKPPFYLWHPFLILVWVQERIFNRKMAKNMRVIRGEVEREPYEIILHSTDISVIGTEQVVMKVLGILSEGVDHNVLYFSWDDSSQKIEDEIFSMQRKLEDGEMVTEEAIDDVAKRLREIPLSMSEWNNIRRQLYRVERDRYKCLYQRSTNETNGRKAHKHEKSSRNYDENYKKCENRFIQD